MCLQDEIYLRNLATKNYQTVLAQPPMPQRQRKQTQ